MMLAVVTVVVVRVVVVVVVVRGRRLQLTARNGEGFFSSDPLLYSTRQLTMLCPPDHELTPSPPPLQVPELGFRFDTEVMTSGDILTPLVEIDIVGGLVSPCSAKLTKARAAQWSTAQPRYIDTSALDQKVEANGLNPRWDKPLDVSCVVWHAPHAFIRFSVYRRSRLPGYQRPLRQLLAYEMIPIASLRQGYRSVPLRSTSGQPIRCGRVAAV